MDVDKTGGVDLNELQQFLDSEIAMAYLEYLGIDSSDAKTLFHLLDNSQAGTINVDSFVKGCLNLRGSAKTLHVAKVEQEVHICQQALCQLEHEIDSAKIMT